MRLHDLSLATRVTIGALAMVIAGTATLLFFENLRLHDAYLSERRAHLEQDIETATLRLNQAISTLRQDVLFLANTPPVSGIVRAALNRGYDPRYGNTHKVWAERLQQIFSAFSKAHPDYYRIRYIGVADDGREIVHIANRGGNIELLPPDRLQAESGHDYFKATLGLREGQVHLSRFNPGQECGFIEQPYRPILCATSPVFTPSGKIFGMVVISMNADSLLKSAASNLAGIETYVANADGRYLLHRDLKFDPDDKRAIATDFPFLKAMLNPQAPDYLPLQAAEAKTDSPLFAARRMRFDPGNPSSFLLLMHYLPARAVAEQAATIPAKTILYELMVMLLVGVIAVYILRRTFSPLKQIAAAADKIAAGGQGTLLLPSEGGEIGSLVSALNAMLNRLSQREILLRESETRYRRLHESMMDAYVMTDMSGRLLEFNHAYQELLGYSAEELRRMSAVDLTPEKWHESEARIVAEEVIPHGYSRVYEKEYIHKNGTVFPVELKIFLLRDANNQPEAMCAIVRDITEHKRIEQRLHDLAAHLQSVREEEKADIAREIHDDMGGTLAALKIETYWLKTEMPPGKDMASFQSRINEMSQLIDKAMGVMRNIITGLRPTILDDLGLLAALEWQAAQFHKHTGIECRVNCVCATDEDCARELDKARSIALFRIVQEALTNVMRHSGASRVEIEFHRSDEEVVMSIIDNGRGLVEKHTDASIPYGMLGMCERADQLGGQVNFDTPPGGGFNVTVILPLPGNEKETI